MIGSHEIHEKARSLTQHFGTNDPIRLAKEMGIKVYDVPTLTELLGMYVCRWKSRIILMNPNINDVLYRMVLAHEIGHDQLHRELAASGDLREFELFNMVDMTEYEANAYAAHILIDDDEMMELLRNGYDLAQAASSLRVNINLLLIKTQEMRRMGMDLRLPFDPDAKFFRNTRY